MGGVRERSAVMMDVLHMARDGDGGKIRFYQNRNIVLGGKSSRPAAADTLITPYCLTRRTGTKIRTDIRRSCPHIRIAIVG